MPVIFTRPVLVANRYNATTGDVNLGSPAHLDNLGAQTVIAVCRETGDHEGNFGYLYGKTPSASANGPRLLLGTGTTGQTRTNFAAHSTAGATGLPSRNGTVGEYIRGEHLFIAARWDGTITATGIRIYLSRNLGPIAEVTYATTTNGTTAIASDAANNFHVGNREGTDRTFNGDIGYVAICKGQLTDFEIELVRCQGPFAVTADWRLIWSNGIDYSPYGVRPTSEVDLLGGERSPYPFFKQQSIWVPVSAGTSGTVAYTNANDSVSASGTTTVTGSLSRTNTNDSVSAAGTTTVVGTLAYTNSNDSVSASGSVGSDVTGTVAYTNANDTVAASGTTTVTGSLARTNASDTLAASGTTTVLGTVSYTNSNDSISASGSSGTSVAATPIVGAGSGKYRERTQKKKLSDDEVWEYINHLKDSFIKKTGQKEELTSASSAEQPTYTELAAKAKVARDYSNELRKQLLKDEFARMQAEINDLELAIMVREQYESWRREEEEMELLLLVA